MYWKFRGIWTAFQNRIKYRFYEIASYVPNMVKARCHYPLQILETLGSTSEVMAYLSEQNMKLFKE